MELSGWDIPSLLTVRVDRLRKWYREGILCIGDAAHAMSPILRKVQQRRELPTRLTQRLQVAAQDRIISRVLESGGKLEVSSLIRLLARFPVLRRIPARLIGLGIRPEHVRPEQVAVRSADSPAPTRLG